MLQRLLIALAQVKVDNMSEGLLNKKYEIIYSLYRASRITKNLYSHTINPITS